MVTESFLTGTTTVAGLFCLMLSGAPRTFSSTDIEDCTHNQLGCIGRCPNASPPSLFQKQHDWMLVILSWGQPEAWKTWKICLLSETQGEDFVDLGELLDCKVAANFSVAES